MDERMASNVAMLAQQAEQNRRQAEEGHHRLRRDLTEGFNDVNKELEKLKADTRADHERIVRHELTRERRREVSMNQAVIIGAGIAGGSRLLEVLITNLFALARHAGP